MKKKRTHNTRLIRPKSSYSVQEVAELYGLHKNAVLRWISAGLPVIDQSKPYLIYGADLVAYLKEKQDSRKQKCKPDEFFCCKCRAPRKAGKSRVDMVIQNESKVSLSARCALCNTAMYRAGSVRKLAEYQKAFSIQSMPKQHITDCNSPSVMCDSRKDI